jgi:hypothetical protein
LLDNIPAVAGYHSGGAHAFGPDDKLYITMGDATNSIISSTNTPLLLVAKDKFHGFSQVEALKLLHLKEDPSNVAGYIQMLKEEIERKYDSLICPHIQERNE